MYPTNKFRLSALALAAVLAAPLAATAPAVAADHHDSTSTLPPRAPDPGPSVLPPPVRQPGPTDLGIGQLPPPPPGGPDGLAAREMEIDRMIHVLLGATDLASPGGACPGMITCYNSAWVTGYDAEQYFEGVCDVYGGVYQTQVLSDGSINYECHYAD